MSITEVSLVLLLLVVLWQGLCISTVDSSGCTPFHSITTEITCIGTLNTSLYIPCGQLNNDTNTNFTYQLYPSNLPSETKEISGFLVLKLQLIHNGMRIICFNYQNQKQAVYKLNVTYAPYSGRLITLPSIFIRYPVAITCPIEANPSPVYEWLRYNDIDQAERLPLPTELQYSNDNRTISVQDWMESMNGFYVCCGTNYLGKTCFSKKTAMRLFATACGGIARPNVMISTSDNNERVYPLSSKVIIYCIAYNAIHNQPPTWFYANSTGINVKIPFKNTSDYNIQYRYDGKECFWNLTIIIMHLSLDLTGSYKCSYGAHVKEANIDVKACDKLKRKDVHLTVSPSNSVAGLRGAHVVLSCMVNGTPSDGIPYWCKVSPNNDCTRLNLTSSINQNCSWINTIEINITDTTQGQYRCVIFDQMQTVQVRLQEGTIINQTTKISPTTLVLSFVATVVFIIITITLILIILHWYRTTKYSRTFEPPYEGFKWDVFISYHSEAEDFANLCIKEALETKGYSVCWHHSDFVGGRTITDNINEAVDTSRKVIFVFTESFTSSDYCMMELNRTLDRLQTTRTRCMIPIALNESGVPFELKSSVTYWPIIDAQDFSTDKLIELIGSPIQNTTTVLHE